MSDLNGSVSRETAGGIRRPARRMAILGGAALVAGATLLAPRTVHAQSLFTTQDDWSANNGGTGDGWAGANGSTVTTVGSTTFDADLSVVDGAGNLTSPGGVSTAPGSMQVNFGGNGYGEVAGISGEQNNAAFLALFDPGATAGSSTATATAAAYSGTLYLYYTAPSTIPANGYFQPGIFLQYSGDGYYGPMLDSAQTTTVVGTNTTGETEMMATIPYTVVAGAFNGLGFGIFANTNAAAGTFYVDDLTTTPIGVSIPEPASLGLLAGVGLLGIRRKRA